MSSIVLLLIYVELTHVMANKMHDLVHLKLELILTKVVSIFCNIGEILKTLSLILKPDRCTETGETGLDPCLSLCPFAHAGHPLPYYILDVRLVCGGRDIVYAR